MEMARKEMVTLVLEPVSEGLVVHVSGWASLVEEMVQELGPYQEQD